MGHQFAKLFLLFLQRHFAFNQSLLCSPYCFVNFVFSERTRIKSVRYISLNILIWISSQRWLHSLVNFLGNFTQLLPYFQRFPFWFILYGLPWQTNNYKDWWLGKLRMLLNGIRTREECLFCTTFLSSWILTGLRSTTRGTFNANIAMLFDDLSRHAFENFISSLLHCLEVTHLEIVFFYWWWGGLGSSCFYLIRLLFPLFWGESVLYTLRFCLRLFLPFYETFFIFLLLF
jgi:hypothetical protein